ncbi:MAG: HAD-IIA family hydrolase [Endozoicomonas sp.]
MVVLSQETLNKVYARHMDWYPPVNNPQELPETVSGLEEVMDNFDLVLLDSYGVLCQGATPIKGAAEAIAKLRAHDIPFCVVSNDTMTNRSVAAEKYRKRGFDFQSHEVLTSLDITETWLKTVTDPEHYGVIAPLEHPSNTLLEKMVRLNNCNGVIPDHIDTLLFLTGTGWTAKMQENLVDSANGRQFNLVVSNPDIGTPNGDRIAATPGYFLASLVEETDQQARPVLLGKPDTSIFEQALKPHTLTEDSRVLMVGDTLYTDILGGNAMGFKTLLLECGICQGKDIHREIKRAGIHPHFIAPQL